MGIKKNLTKKILLTAIIFTVSFNFVFFSTPKKAEAIFGVADTAIVFDPAVSSQVLGKTIWDKAEYYAGRALSIVVRIAAKKLINNITQATVSWINGGMQGQPAYKADFHKFMTGPGGVDDQIMGEFFQNNGLNFLCSPFQLQVKLALQLGYGAGLKEKIGCTLTQIEQNASDALRNSNVSLGVDVNGTTITGGVHDFRNKDGWNEWLSTTMQPQNNPIGAYLIAKDELTVQTNNAEINKQLEFLNGGGALNFTRCVDKYYDGNNKLIWTSPEYTSGTGQTGRPKASSDVQDKVTKIDPVCSVKTPGSVITGGLNKITGSTIDQAGLSATLSDGLDAVLGALLNYYMSKLSKGVLDSNAEGYNNYNTALNDSYTTAIDTYNSDLSNLYDEQANFNNTDWTNPNWTIPTFDTPNVSFDPSIFYLGTSSWVWDPITGDPFVYSTSTNYATSSWVYDPSTGLPLVYATTTTATNNNYYGPSALDLAKNNANTLLSSLLNSELAYQNNYKIAQNVLTQAEKVFASSSACNISYNRTDYTLRSLLIRANVVTNIEGLQDSNRTIASIPWNLQVIQKALATSSAKVTILNKAANDVSGAGSITAVTDAMTPVNSTSFDTDPQAQMVSNIKTWLTGVGTIYNSLLCPIDLTKVLQINSSTSTVQ